jgi:hypothetical protein
VQRNFEAEAGDGAPEEWWETKWGFGVLILRQLLVGPPVRTGCPSGRWPAGRFTVLEGAQNASVSACMARIRLLSGQSGVYSRISPAIPPPSHNSIGTWRTKQGGVEGLEIKKRMGLTTVWIARKFSSHE